MTTENKDTITGQQLINEVVDQCLENLAKGAAENPEDEARQRVNAAAQKILPLFKDNSETFAALNGFMVVLYATMPQLLQLTLQLTAQLSQAAREKEREGAGGTKPKVQHYMLGKYQSE